MPMFEYECSSCGALFEELVMSAAQEIACPSCGSGDVEKLISRIAKSCGCSSSGGASCGPT